MQQLPKQPNRSVLEGIEVLLAVSRSGGAVRVRELARELGMTPTRLQRYLATLAYGGLLRRREDRKYEAGPGMHALSAISLTASGLAGRALRLLPPLSESGCIVALGVVWRQSVSYLYFHVPGMAVMHSLGKESTYPARESSIGRVLLSQMSKAELLRSFGEDGDSLDAELAEVRKRGYERLRRSDGEESLAVPVGSPAIAGLALSGRMAEEQIQVRLEELRDVAARLAAP